VLIIRRTSGSLDVIRPSIGWCNAISDLGEFVPRFRKLPDDEAAAGWDELWMDALQTCLHGPNCVNGASCAIGKRVRWFYILSGSCAHHYWHILKHGSSAERVLKDRNRAREGPLFAHVQFGEHACVGVLIKPGADPLPPEEVVSSWLSVRSHEWKENDFPTFDGLFDAWPPSESSSPV